MKLWRYGRPIEHIAQRYRLEGVLGSGGMAEVCLAWDEREQREVAIKILKSDDLDQDTLNRFMKEASQIVSWQHPHILCIYENMQIELIDAAQGSVLFYIVMEYARGGDLHKRLSPGKAFPLSASFSLFHQLCSAVQYAHEHGVIHRDLKPLNILFRRPETGSEEVVLSDFGLAVQVDASHHTFARGGTLAYMAPEQFQGHAMPASDIFALGVILYQMCTGRLPFRRSIQDFYRTDAPSTPTRPSLFNADLPAMLDEPILRALNELPAERYRNAQEFWLTLETALATSAQTYPFLDDRVLERGALETWPLADSERRSPFSVQTAQTSQTSQAGHFAAPDPLSPGLVAAMEEGAEPSPGLVREKQKAPPGMAPSLSLPTHSIPAQPNRTRHQGKDPAVRRGLPARNRLLGSSASNNQFSQQKTWPENVTRDLSPAGAEIAEHQSQVQPSRALFTEPLSGRRSRAPLPSEDDAPAQAGEYTTYRPFEGLSQTGRSQRGLHTPEQSIIAFPGGETVKPETARSVRRPIAMAGTRTTRTLPAAPSRPSISRPPQATPTGMFGGAWPPFRLKSKRLTGLWKLPFVPLLSILTALILMAAMLVAASAQGWLFASPTVVVTLTPRSQSEQNSYALVGLSRGIPDATKQQIPATLLSATSATQSVAGKASGSLPGTQASGKLTFINNGSTPVMIDASEITGNSGVAVTFHGPITVPVVPASSLVVTGFAVNAGSKGNIPVLDIVKPCCAPNIVVKNTTAFTGGQDAQPASVVEQQDIDRAAQPFIKTLTGHEQTLLKQQVTSNERAIDSSLECTPTSISSVDVGKQAKAFTVSVTVTCSEEVYDYQAAQALASRLLQADASRNPAIGPSYNLVGAMVFSVTSTTVAAPTGNVTINIQARGTWRYIFSSARLSNLTRLIMGKSQADARTLLGQQAGVAAVRFSGSASLPGNPTEIKVVIS